MGLAPGRRGGQVSAAPEDGRTGGLGEAAAASPFERFTPADVHDLITQFPLAWVCARTAEPATSLLPLLGDYDAEGRLCELVGHMSRRNPLAAALANDPRALVLFQGPQGYVSPEHAGRRDWAPTWNYAQLCIEAQVRFMPDETGVAVRRLVDTMEAGRSAPWGVEELGHRYQAMERQIVGFRARVTHLCGRFKLGQDESPETVRAIIASTPDAGLASWMRRFNPDRL
jgi:transcriptional regulator